MRNDPATQQVNNQNNNNQILNANANFHQTNPNYKFIASHFNYVIVVLLALALNDLAKFYINRSIKFQNGSHTYFIYYCVGISLLLYIVSKYVNQL